MASTRSRNPQAKGQQNKSRRPSAGSVLVIEEDNGELRVQLDLSLMDETSPDLVDRIRSAVAGMAYTYELAPDAIEALGMAHISGIDKGMSFEEHKPTKVTKTPTTEKQSMGFHDHTKTVNGG